MASGRDRPTEDVARAERRPVVDDLIALHRQADDGEAGHPPRLPHPGRRRPRGGGFVVEMIAMTMPATRSATEQESAATTHIGGRRLKRCAVIVRWSCPIRWTVGCIRCCICICGCIGA